MTEVVTAVLRYNNKILLLKRSDTVRTYRGHWACVSGYLEQNETPLMRAFTEIKEETGLTQDQVTLTKTGTTVDFYDDATEEQWIIHPFLFDTSTNIITIDWEHTTYAWISPQDITSYVTVPKLEGIIRALLITQL